MINGLAGPLHGLANQEVLRWLHDIMEKMGGEVPTENEMKQFVWDLLEFRTGCSGFWPCRTADNRSPLYDSARICAETHEPMILIFKYVDILYKVVPPILKEQGKAKNPWPNVDAHSGVIQWHYGVKEYDFYTVLFGIGRAIGICANIIWDRALGYPLERPKSVTTDMLEKIARGEAPEDE